MKSIFGRAVELFEAGGLDGAEAFRFALKGEVRDTAEMILDLKWPWVQKALAAEFYDPMAPDYEALGNDELTSQYADSRESAEAPAIQ